MEKFFKRKRRIKILLLYFRNRIFEYMMNLRQGGDIIPKGLKMVYHGNKNYIK